MERIGIDIGGTKIAFARVDEHGQILAHHRLPTTPADGVTGIVSHIADGVSALGGDESLPVGVGCAGVVEAGTIRYAGNLGWRDVPLQQLLIEKLNRRVVVENDVRAALVGEMRYGVARGVSDAVYLAVGTGLGASAIVNGQVLRGFKGMAMELGYMRQPNGELYEHGASGTGLGMIAKSLGMTDDTHRILDLARAGDETALRAIAILTDNIALVASWACAVLNPQMVILGGGMGLALGDSLVRGVMLGIETRCADFVRDGLTVQLAQVQNNAVGAAALG